MPTLRQLLKNLVGVEVVLDGVEYPNNYSDELAIDRTNLEEEFVSHSERYAYYATLAEMAEDRHTRLKEELDELEARLDHEIRADADSIRLNDPKFKMTETMVANEIKLRPEYRDKLKLLQDARHLSKVLKAAPMAFAHRRDMLIELGKSHLSSMNDPRIAGGKQQQVKNMFARKSEAPQLPSAEEKPTGTLCSVCHEPQFMTEHGVVCEKGHGGAPPLEEPQTMKQQPIEQPKAMGNSQPGPGVPTATRRRAPRSA